MKEPEISDELAALIDISKSIDEDSNRLRNLHRKGKLHEVLADELVSTILPLLSDFAKATVASAGAVEEWSIGIDDTIDSAGGMAPSPLDSEAVGLFSWLFARLQDFVSGAKAAPEVPSTTLKALLEIEVKLKLAQGILDRLGDAEDDEEDEDLEKRTGGEGSESDED